MAETQPLNSAQLAAIRAQYESQLREAIAGLHLRRWLVEKMLEKTSTTADVKELLTVAAELHAFIVEPALRVSE